jgi:hypothetical protein
MPNLFARLMKAVFSCLVDVAITTWSIFLQDWSRSMHHSMIGLSRTSFIGLPYIRFEFIRAVTIATTFGFI